MCVLLLPSKSKYVGLSFLSLKWNHTLVPVGKLLYACLYVSYGRVQFVMSLSQCCQHKLLCMSHLFFSHVVEPFPTWKFLSVEKDLIILKSKTGVPARFSLKSRLSYLTPHLLSLTLRNFVVGGLGRIVAESRIDECFIVEELIDFFYEWPTQRWRDYLELTQTIFLKFVAPTEYIRNLLYCRLSLRLYIYYFIFIHTFFLRLLTSTCPLLSGTGDTPPNYQLQVSIIIIPCAQPGIVVFVSVTYINI